MKTKNETALLIDAAYLNLSAKAAGWNMDMLKLKRLLEEKANNKGPIREGHYLNSVAPEHLTDSVHRFHTYLKSAEPTGPQLRVELYGHKKMSHTCPGCKHTSYRRIQQGVDVAIAMRIIMLSEKYDQLILLAGDADFLDAVRYMKAKGTKRLVIAGFRGSVSADLQSYADEVIWLDDYAAIIRREAKAA